MKKVCVVGAGLAGLTVARQLARHGFAVTVVEASQRAGGKAGGDVTGGRLFEHGYHIFPRWYRNVRPIVDELGVKLIDFDRWHSRVIEQGGAKRWVTTQIPSSASTLYKAIFDGLMPWPDAMLYYYFVLDMLAEPLTNKALLDQVSRVGLMRDRWYMTQHIPEMESENVLKASAIPLYEMSAMTAKKISAFWVKTPLPFLSILPGDLQTTFAGPYAKKVESEGVAFRFGHRVKRVALEGELARGVVAQGPDGEVAIDADAVVVTTPLEVTRALMDGALQRADPDLGTFQHLQAAPMASLHLQFDRKLDGIPREHCFLHEGRYGLSFIDCAQAWGGDATYLSFIASNFIPLQQLDTDSAFEALWGEIERYLDLPRDAVTQWKLNPNTNVPLFINTVGAWDNRAPVRSRGVPNLYFAGDWAKNGVDLACMEGAVSSALHTARELAKAFGVEGLQGPLAPFRYPEWTLRLAKWLLAPAMVPVHLASRLGASRR